MFKKNDKTLTIEKGEKLKMTRPLASLLMIIIN